MAFIPYRDEEHHDEALTDALMPLRDPQHGVVDNIMRISSLNLPFMQAHQAFYRELMYGKSPLTRPQREMVALVVSSINACHY